MMDNLLLNELIKLSDYVHSTQRYLILQEGNSKANYDGGATSAEAVKMIGEKLDKLIAIYVTANVSQLSPTIKFGSRILGAVRYEMVRQKTLLEWGQTAYVI
jgi:hypothetical protein